VDDAHKVSASGVIAVRTKGFICRESVLLLVHRISYPSTPIVCTFFRVTLFLVEYSIFWCSDEVAIVDVSNRSWLKHANDS